LEFAFKYDEVNLSILVQIFEVVDENELLTYLRSKPIGKYARRIWFFYEYLTDKRLPLEDLKQGNYVDLLEHESELCRRVDCFWTGEDPLHFAKAGRY